MHIVTSDDGTKIAVDVIGDGPPVALVSGASCARGVHADLAELLARDFTVLNYDRRGRGDSGDTQPYSVRREVDDLAAVLELADGPAFVFGNSSGAVLALRAAAAGLAVRGLALWEPPFMTDPDAPGRQREYATQLGSSLDAGRPGDAMALFLRTVGLPEPMIDGMRHSPMWAGMEAIAPTLRYDAEVMGDSLVPAGLGEIVTVPVLVLTGSKSGSWAEQAAAALLRELPGASHRVLDGQDHNVAWDVLAPEVAAAFQPG